ncbi:MAG: ankyrin repeat domain-containing protein [Alphaproteobacteria bacterium]|nr:ankyrin repeat domain-containing protein [Alphaproteobacteria bacterium]
MPPNKDKGEALLFQWIQHDVEAPVGGINEPPLIMAAMHGLMDLAQALINKGANINATGINGKTALHTAMQREQGAIAKLLLKNGADINARNKDQDTPLISAAFFGYKDMVQLLLAHGADVNAQNQHGMTALHF